MKNTIKLFLLLALFVLAAPAFCAEDFLFEKLKNGQTVIVKKVSANPTVTIDTWIKTGSINETDKISGVAHFLEHLFFKGTKNNPTGTFDRVLESKGAVTNAGTSKDFTHYYVTLPSKDFDLALSLHSDMLLNPLIPRKELEKERLVVLEEISKGKDSPQNVMWENLFELMYSNGKEKHPYARPVIGEDKVISSITREEILDFYNTFYTPQNMTTVIVGDVEPKEVLSKAKEYFEAKNSAISSQIVYPKISPINSILRKTQKMDVNQAYGVIAFHAPKFIDDKDGYALDVLSVILGQSKSSKLNQVLKEEKRLVYGISSSYSAFLDDGIFSFSFTCEQKNLADVEKEILNQISKIKKGQVTLAELNKAKNMIKTDTYYSRESISNIASEIGYLTTLWGSTWYYDNYLQNIEKVKLQDVIKVAKKYFDNDNYAVSLVLPNKSEENLKEISQVAYASKIPQALEPVEQNGDIKKYLLSNGATLIVKQNDTNSIIAFDIQAKGSKLLEKIPSTATIAAQTAKQGTKKYSNAELAKFLDEKGIKLSLSSGQDAFSISLQTTKDELNSALDVLDEVVNNPNFSTSETEKIKKLNIAALKRVEDNALSIALDEFKHSAFKNSYYGQNAKMLLNSVEQITPDEIKEYYFKILDPQNLVIAVVGNVDEQEIINKMTQIFQPKNGEKITFGELKMNTFVPQKNIDTVLTKPETQSAWVLVGYKTCPIYNEKDRATLGVINAILGEGMSSRLFTTLRDEQGLAYSVGSSIMQNVLDGAFVAYIATNNQSIDKAKQGLISEIERLRREFVCTQELQEAKDKILGNLVVSIETNMDNASQNAWYALTERPINQLEEYKKLINSVDKSDILEVANKYFSKSYISVVVKAP